MKAKEINYLIERQREIFWHCSKLFKEINYLSSAHENSDHHESVLLSSLFNSVTGYYWSILILELCKLYSKNSDDYYRIEKTIKLLINNFKRFSLKDKISKESLKFVQDELDSQAFELNLKKLKKIRDNYVAHKGFNPEVVQIHLHGEIKYFMELTTKVIENILNPVLGNNAHYIEHPDSLENHIEKYIKLEKFHDKMEEIISSSIGKENSVLSKGTIEELQNVLGRNFVIDGISDC